MARAMCTMMHPLISQLRPSPVTPTPQQVQFAQQAMVANPHSPRWYYEVKIHWLAHCRMRSSVVHFLASLQNGCCKYGCRMGAQDGCQRQVKERVQAKCPGQVPETF